MGRPIRLAAAMAAHSSRSMPSPLSSTSARRSSERWPSKSFDAASTTASCSSLCEKSTVPLLPGSSRKAEPEHGDEIPLDLVGAPTEGEDQQTAVVAFQAAAEDRLGGPVLEVPALADD